eukprot:3333271-Pyramimonas_sp.AAC.1
MSKPVQNTHHRRVDTIIVIGLFSIGAVICFAVVTVIVATSIAATIIVFAVVDVAILPRPPESPTRIEVPARLRGLRNALRSAQRSAPPRPRRSRHCGWPLFARACAR